MLPIVILTRTHFVEDQEFNSFISSLVKMRLNPAEEAGRQRH
jgi:hypothetical protein